MLGSPIMTKRYCFMTEDDAVRFLTHLDVMRESGKKLKQIFEDIDKRSVGQISQSSLVRAMKENGMDNSGTDGMEEASKVRQGEERSDSKRNKAHNRTTNHLLLVASLIADDRACRLRRFLGDRLC